MKLNQSKEWHAEAADREILNEFAMEERCPEPALLREYISKYPWLQSELEELHIAFTKEKLGRPE